MDARNFTCDLQLHICCGKGQKAGLTLSCVSVSQYVWVCAMCFHCLPLMRGWMGRNQQCLELKCEHAHTDANAHTLTYPHTIHVHSKTRSHTCIRSHTHTHTHAHTHTHTHIVATYACCLMNASLYSGPHNKKTSYYKSWTRLHVPLFLFLASLQFGVAERHVNWVICLTAMHNMYSSFTHTESQNSFCCVECAKCFTAHITQVPSQCLTKLIILDRTWYF